METPTVVNGNGMTKDKSEGAGLAREGRLGLRGFVRGNISFRFYYIVYIKANSAPIPFPLSSTEVRTLTCNEEVPGSNPTQG